MKSRHHRLPKYHGGSGTYPPDNILVTTKAKHRAFNLLFGSSPTIEEVVHILNAWTDSRYRITIRKSEVQHVDAERNEARTVRRLFEGESVGGHMRYMWIADNGQQQDCDNP